jgi:protein required for attachment to host cells
MKKTTTWIVVADHQHVRVFLDDGSGGGLLPVDEMSRDERHGASHELVESHRPDKGFSARGGISHGYEQKVDPHEQAGRAFLERLADDLSGSLERGAFDRLVLIAPPKALGELRQVLPDGLGQRVAGELDLDLTKASPAEVQNHVATLAKG